MIRSSSKTSGLLARWQRLVALAAGAAWMLAALTCPSFGQAMAPDEPVAAHENIAGLDAGHADNDLCCTALGDSTTVYQALTYLHPDLIQAPAPTIAVAEILPAGQVNALPRDRPPIAETTRGREKRFVSFSSRAPPTIHV